MTNEKMEMVAAENMEVAKENEKMEVVVSKDFEKNGEISVKGTHIKFVVHKVPTTSRVGKIRINIKNDLDTYINATHESFMLRAFDYKTYPVEFQQTEFGPYCVEMLKGLASVLKDNWFRIPDENTMRLERFKQVMDIIVEYIKTNYYALSCELGEVIQFKDEYVHIDKKLFQTEIVDLLRQIGFNQDTEVISVFQANHRMVSSEGRSDYRAPSILDGNWCYKLKLDVTEEECIKAEGTEELFEEVA